jgi:hypothetical protein
MEGVERSDPGSCESEICRWPNEPRARRSAVEVPCLCGTGCGRGVSIGGASYESELERGRRALSSWPRTRRTLYAVEACCLLLWFDRFDFYYHWLWVPHTVGTDTCYSRSPPLPTRLAELPAHRYGTSNKLRLQVRLIEEGGRQSTGITSKQHANIPNAYFF